MQIGCDVVAHQSKETRDGKGFVAVTQDLEVYRFVVVQVAQKRDDGVYGYHEQDPNDAANVSKFLRSAQARSRLLLLFVWFQVMCRMPQDEEEGYGEGEGAKGR